MTTHRATCRLSDTVAACRLLYLAPVPTAPDVMLIDVPSEQRGLDLLLARWYPIILENAAERAELDAFLHALRCDPIAPDLFDLRTSTAWSSGVTIIRYERPSADWPLLLTCRWPGEWSRAVVAEGVALARGCHTTDAFMTEEAIERHLDALLASLRADRTIEIKLISADRLAAAGRT